MTNPTQALLWYCWRRSRYAIGIQLLSVIAFGIVYLMVFSTNETDIVRSNVITLTALVGAWLLSAVLSSTLAKSTTSGMASAGFGFPLRAEFHFPVSSFQLTLVPLSYCVLVAYACFIGPAVLLAMVFDLSMPSPMIHFMVVEYFLIVLSLSWFTNHGPEALVGSVLLVLCFYFEIIIPDFSVEEETSLFVPGPWSSVLMPFVIIVASVAAMFIGVSKQRSGENFMVKGGRNQIITESISALNWFRFVRTTCPTDSSRAAMVWRERQSRGLQTAAGIGLTTGVVVVLVLYLLQLREFTDSDYMLEDVTAFAVIALCTLFTGALVSMFGLSFKNGDVKVSVFDRTLPLSTAEIVTIRVVVSFLCVIVAGLVQIVTIGIVGPLVIENFASVRVEFFEGIQSITDRGGVYTTLRTILLLCFIFNCAVLWAVNMSWFAMKTKMMSIVSSGLMVYGILLVVVMVSIEQPGQEYLRMSRDVRDFHAWIFMAVALGAMVYFLSRLIKDEVITPMQAIVICTVGLVLAAIQVVMLSVHGETGGDIRFAVSTLRQFYGLFPLAAVVLALWTQHKLRHE